MIEPLKGLKGFSAWAVYNKVAFNLIFLLQFNRKDPDFEALFKKADKSESLDELRALIPQIIERTHNNVLNHQLCIQTLKKADKNTRLLMMLEALQYADLSDDEILRLLALHKDNNEVFYNKSNIANINTEDLVPLMLESLDACADLNVDLFLVDNEQIDDLKGKRINIKNEVADILANNPDVNTSELLTLAIKRALKGR